MINYPKIRRLSSVRKLDKLIRPLDIVEISEKVDGSNASFCLDPLNPSELKCFSRESEVVVNDNLKGFYEWVNTSVAAAKDKLNPNYIYFGEWLVKHKIAYGTEHYSKFYFYDIYDKEYDRWLSVEEKECIFPTLERIEGLVSIPRITMSGKEFLSKDKAYINSLLSKSFICNDKEPEGIVIKIYDKSYNGEPFFFKIFNPQFEEVKKRRMNKVKTKAIEFELLETVCTEARVEKIILKMLIDTGELKDEDMYVENMPTLIKLITPKVSADIFEEESELLEVWKKEYSLSDKVIEKTINRITPKYINGYIRRVENENSYF